MKAVTAATATDIRLGHDNEEKPKPLIEIVDQPTLTSAIDHTATDIVLARVEPGGATRSALRKPRLQAD